MHFLPSSGRNAADVQNRKQSAYNCGNEKKRQHEMKTICHLFIVMYGMQHIHVIVESNFRNRNGYRAKTILDKDIDIVSHSYIYFVTAVFSNSDPKHDIIAVDTTRDHGNEILFCFCLRCSVPTISRDILRFSYVRPDQTCLQTSSGF